jgi:2-amino-4-hydroxy-6-hydroxymethyldihydropteridine diphosphokinase
VTTRGCDIAIAYIGLGSNENDREDNLLTAVRRLAAHPRIEVDAVSPIYETEPVGVIDQPLFFNAAVSLVTDLSPEELLAVLKSVETAMGRRQTFRWGPRCIDLDLLLYDDAVVASPDLVVPHRQLHRRAFVLVPLAEIAPQAVVPRSGKTVIQLRDALGEISGVRLRKEKFCQQK